MPSGDSRQSGHLAPGSAVGVARSIEAFTTSGQWNLRVAGGVVVSRQRVPYGEELEDGPLGG